MRAASRADTVTSTGWQICWFKERISPPAFDTVAGPRRAERAVARARPNRDDFMICGTDHTEGRLRHMLTRWSDLEKFGRMMQTLARPTFSLFGYISR